MQHHTVASLYKIATGPSEPRETMHHPSGHPYRIRNDHAVRMRQNIREQPELPELHTENRLTMRVPYSAYTIDTLASNGHCWDKQRPHALHEAFQYRRRHLLLMVVRSIAPQAGLRTLVAGAPSLLV